jgi:transcriptional regulator with XRE-family HTH domain
MNNVKRKIQIIIIFLEGRGCVNEIGDRIKSIRMSNALTQGEFAQKTGVSQSNVSRFEKNELLPSSQAIIQICISFNINTAWLLLGEGSMVKDEISKADEYESVILKPGQSELLEYYDQLPTFEQGRLVEYARSRITLMGEVAARNSISTNDKRHKPRKVRLSKKS